MSITRNQLRIITINDICILWGKIGKFTKIIGSTIHGSRKKKRGQSRITGKIKDSNSRFTKKIKLNSRITEKIRGGQFTVHEENKTQFTVHSKNKSPITVHGNTSLRPSCTTTPIFLHMTVHPTYSPSDCFTIRVFTFVGHEYYRQQLRISPWPAKTVQSYLPIIW